MQWLYVLGLVYSIVLAFVYGVAQINPEFMLVFSNVLFPATAGITVIASFWILKRYVGHNPKPMFSMAWVCFSTGLSLWFLGELTWAIYILVLQADPFPSFADVLYIGGYVPLFLTLFLILKLFQSVFTKKTLMLELGVTVGFFSFVVSYLLVLPIIQSSEDILSTALSAAYPILDIGLFAEALGILLIFIKGSIGKAWFFLTLGIILNIVADLFFTYGELQGFYYEGHPFELFWLWGYIAFLSGIYIHRREL